MGKEQAGKERIRCSGGERDVGFGSENLQGVTQNCRAGLLLDYGRKNLNFTDISA